MVTNYDINLVNPKFFRIFVNSNSNLLKKVILLLLNIEDDSDKTIHPLRTIMPPSNIDDSLKTYDFNYRINNIIVNIEINNLKYNIVKGRNKKYLDIILKKYNNFVVYQININTNRYDKKKNITLKKYKSNAFIMEIYLEYFSNMLYTHSGYFDKKSLILMSLSCKKLFKLNELLKIYLKDEERYKIIGDIKNIMDNYVIELKREDINKLDKMILTKLEDEQKTLLKKNYDKGIKDGSLKESKIIAKRLLDLGVSYSIIEKVCYLSIDELSRLKEDIC